MTRITDIVDNRVAAGFAAEHGLSLLIEYGDERILFDTGAGAVGLYLCHATDNEIEWTGDFLRQLNLDRLILLHCTGETAGAKLKEMLPCPVVWGEAGSSTSR